MSHKAIEFLTNIYKVEREKIVFVDHGVPKIQLNRIKSREEFNPRKQKGPAYIWFYWPEERD